VTKDEAASWPTHLHALVKKLLPIVGKKSEENARRLNPQPAPIPKSTPKEKLPDVKPTPLEPEVLPEEPLTTVSDQMIINALIGSWQLDLGYNAYGQYVIIQSVLYPDGSMSAQTFFK
jgi:hypothetical protein